MKFIKTISIIIAHYRKKEKNGGISCPRKHILNYSETRYMEIMGNIE